MFNNIGRKIRVLAMVLCWIGIIAFVITGIAMLVNAGNLEKELKEAEKAYRNSYSSYSSYRTTTASATQSSISAIRTTAWCIIILGPLFSWIGSFLLYGFGELVEKTAHIDATVSSLDRHSSVPGAAPVPSPLQALDNAFRAGVITAAEYEEKKATMKY